MIRTDTEVEWKWGDGVAAGVVKEIHHETVTRTIDGSEVTRHGSDEDPAYIIQQDDGGVVLKLQSEVSRAD